MVVMHKLANGLGWSSYNKRSLPYPFTNFTTPNRVSERTIRRK